MGMLETPRGALSYRMRGAGPTALFIHAYMLDGALWTAQLLGLSGARRCIAPDLIGHGRSDPLPEDDLDPDRDAADLWRLLDVLVPDEPVDLVGASGGGIIAAVMAAARPDRVRSLTLCSTVLTDGPGPDTKAYHAEMARLAVVESREVLFRRFDEYIRAGGASLMARARYKEMLCRTPHETIVAQMTGASLRPRPELVPQIACPVLLAHGDVDVLATTGRIDAALAAMPTARRAVIERCGRLAPLENPAALNDALRDFWDSAS
jgi:pimeloyl-ACP methyl ester carboxylesterase